MNLGPNTKVIFSIIKRAAATAKPAPTAPALANAIKVETVGSIPFHLRRLRAAGKIDVEYNRGRNGRRFYVPELGRWTDWTRRVLARRRVHGMAAVLAVVVALAGCAGTDYGGVNYVTTDGTNWKVVGGKDGDNIALEIVKGADGSTTVRYSAARLDAAAVQAKINERLAMAIAGMANLATTGVAP